METPTPRLTGVNYAYAARVAAETRIYQDCLDVHNLPPIFHYWSNRHIRPRFERFGFACPDAMFRKYAERQLLSKRSPVRMGSLGSGNCQLEIDLAASLQMAGHHDFTIDCLDLNPHMLERGRIAAAGAGAGGQLRFLQADLNNWTPKQEYDVILANQSLHHVVNLESLFATARDCLADDGVFLVSDMIGRNGHQRWPEALELVREFWRKLPPSYRFNRSLQRYEERFEDWDCSGESFEGIRAQDILPLLVESFHFELFIPYGNAIDPFVDRSFGFNFDARNPWDRDFIDEVQARDEKELAAGAITPTHLLAVLCQRPQQRRMLSDSSLNPAQCVRDPDASVRAVRRPSIGQPYEWGVWPHSDREELKIACHRITRMQAEASEKERIAEERTQWAQRADRELERAAEQIGRLQNELSERAEWARSLNAEIERAGEKIASLHGDLEDRTRWAQDLETSMEEERSEVYRLRHELQENRTALQAQAQRLAWALALDRHFHRPLSSLHRLLRKAVRVVRDRLPVR